MFFKRLAMLLKDNPPYPVDAAMVERLKRIGVEPGEDFDPSKLDPGIRKGINEAPFMVWHKFATGPYEMTGPNGWSNMLNVGRYGTDYETRAFVAYFGMGAGVKEDIIYPSTFVNGNGWLDGAHKYVMHLEKADMALAGNAVWSVSPYRENFYIHNVLNRYGTAARESETQREWIAGHLSAGDVTRTGQRGELAADSGERDDQRDAAHLRPAAGSAGPGTQIPAGAESRLSLYAMD